MSIQDGVGVIALGALSYGLSYPTEIISPNTSQCMKMAGFASVCWGGKMIWEGSATLVNKVVAIKDRIINSKVPTPQALAACALTYSIPPNSVLKAIVAVGSGAYLYRSLPSYQEVVENLSGYSTEHDLHIDSPFNVKLEGFDFEFGSLGAAYLAHQVKLKFATQENLGGKSADEIAQFLAGCPQAHKWEGTQPSLAFKKDTMMVLLKHKFGIGLHPGQMTDEQKRCRQVLLATNRKDFKHPSVHGFTGDQMNALLKRCYDLAFAE